jgi:DNA polymerase-3 subunit epsilon
VALGEARWVVLDCETSGLDPARDRLLSVGAVAVQGERIALGESFEALLRQERPSEPANILVHGIGGDAQRAGVAPAQALDGLARFVAQSLPVAFNAAFDAEVLRRAGFSGSAHPWLDVARLAPALCARPPRSLDEWLDESGIEAPRRHDALADAFATAELFLVLLAEARRQGIGTVGALRSAERSGRWLGR